MKKRKNSGHIYDDAVTVENMYKMWRIVRRTCKNRRELAVFGLNLYSNLSKICYELNNRAYVPGKYRTFLIFEPKPRLVMSQSVRDKLVNHFVANFYLLPYLERELIDSNVATRTGYGTSYAMSKLKGYFDSILAGKPGARIYALKVDVSKYFYTIDHGILMKKLRRKILDPDVIGLIETIISETDKTYINRSIERYNKRCQTDIPPYVPGRGLSIGAMTSQFLAIYYLNDLDHKIKEHYHCRYYIRYMDDFLILSTDKNELRMLTAQIAKELGKLKLVVNPKSRIYNCNDGFVFLGYRYQVRKETLHIDCCPKTVRRIRRHLQDLAKTDLAAYYRSTASYGGYFKYGDINRVLRPEPAMPKCE